MFILNDTSTHLRMRPEPGDIMSTLLKAEFVGSNFSNCQGRQDADIAERPLSAENGHRGLFKRPPLSP